MFVVSTLIKVDSKLIGKAASEKSGSVILEYLLFSITCCHLCCISIDSITT